MKKMDEKKLKEDSGFPYGWNKGDTCVMITRSGMVMERRSAGMYISPEKRIIKYSAKR